MVGVDDPTISPDSPIVLTLKVLYSTPGLSAEEQGRRGRAEMLATSFREYEQRIPRAVYCHVCPCWFRHAARHRGHCAEPLGARLPQSAAGIFLRQQRHSRAARTAA